MIRIALYNLDLEEPEIFKSEKSKDSLGHEHYLKTFEITQNYKYLYFTRYNNIFFNHL